MNSGITRSRFWIGVEHTPGDTTPRGLLRLAIIEATLELWNGRGSDKNWILERGPATHAFVAYQDIGGQVKRIDSCIPSVLESSWFIDTDTALWEIIPSLEHNVEPDYGIRAAKLMRGIPYDLPEMFFQAAALFIPPMIAARVKLPWEGIKKFVICTTLVCKCLEDCGGDAQKIGRALLVMDHYPEAIGQAMRASENLNWVRRCSNLLHPEEEF